MLYNIMASGRRIKAELLEQTLLAEKAVDSIKLKTYTPVQIHSELDVIYYPVQLSYCPILFNFTTPVNEGSLPIHLQSGTITNTLVSGTVFNYSTFAENTLTTGIVPTSFSTSNNIHFCIVASINTTSVPTTIISATNPTFSIRINTDRTITITIGTSSASTTTSVSTGWTTLVFVFSGTVGGTTTTVNIRDCSNSTFTPQLTINSGIPTSLSSLKLGATADGNREWSHFALINLESVDPDHLRAKLIPILPITTSVKNKLRFSGRKYIVAEVKHLEDRYFEVLALSTGASLASTEVNLIYTNKNSREIIEDILARFTSLKFITFGTLTFTTYPIFNAKGKIIDIFLLLLTPDRLTFDVINSYFILRSREGGQVSSTASVTKMIPKESVNLFGQTKNVYVLTDVTEDSYSEAFTGNGTQTVFTLRYIPTQTTVKVNGVKQDHLINYTVDHNRIIFRSAPANGASITVDYQYKITPVVKASANVGVADLKVFTTLADYSAMKRYALNLLQASNRDQIAFLIPVGGEYTVNDRFTYTGTTKHYTADYYYYMIFDSNFKDQVSLATPSFTGNYTTVLGYSGKWDFVKTALWYNNTSFTAIQNLQQAVSADWAINVILLFRAITGTTDVEVLKFDNVIIRRNGSTLKIIVGTSTLNYTISANRFYKISILHSGTNTFPVMVDGVTVGVINSTASTIINSVRYGDSTGTNTDTEAVVDMVVISKNKREILSEFLNDALPFRIIAGTTDYIIKEVRVNYPWMTITCNSFDYDSIQIEKEYYEKIHSLEQMVIQKVNESSVQTPIEYLVVADTARVNDPNRVRRQQENVNINDTALVKQFVGWDNGRWDDERYL